MASANPFDLWVKRPKPNPQARLRLICLPYAGGTASIYRSWSDLLPPQIELWAIQLPGRETRLRETPATSMNALVPLLADVLAPHLDRPWAIFGHSLGGLISFALAQYLRQQTNRTPVHHFVSGCPAPQLPLRHPPRHGLPDAEFMSELAILGGTPPEILAHPELMQLMLPILRADFALFEQYSYQPAAPFAWPLTALGGLSDPETNREELQGWQMHTSATFTLRMYPGDHFFINTGRNLVLQSVAQELRPYLR